MIKRITTGVWVGSILLFLIFFSYEAAFGFNPDIDTLTFDFDSVAAAVSSIGAGVLGVVGLRFAYKKIQGMISKS